MRWWDVPNGSINVKCPFFERENQTTIFCESNIGTGFYAQVFRTSVEKTAFMRAHCAKFPDMNCPCADYLNDIYGGKEE